MSVQARLSEGDRRLYSVNRDVAHNFKYVMQLVAQRFDEDAWPAITSLCKREGVLIGDIDKALACYCEYVVMATTHPDRDMLMALEVSGFFDCHATAQVCVMAMIGTTYAGIQFVGVREATVGSEGPMLSMGDLVQAATKFRNYTTMSRFRRSLIAYYRRFLTLFDRS